MKKSVIILVVIIVTLLNFVLQTSAHEFAPGVPHRWNDVRYTYSGGMYHHYAYVLTNGSNLDSNWSGNYYNSINNWTNNSSLRAYVQNAAVGSSKVDYYTYTTWPSYWPSNVIARTLGYDANGNCWIDPVTGVTNTNCGVNITYASVNTNPNFGTISSDQKLYILTHELGHVLGLGHPSSTDVSIMHTGDFPSWNNWTLPQAHDRSDLIGFYP
ncbi:hypothetical protein [Pseudobacteroides cellulosolvens]|uniref:Peptidase M10A and M12B matrixin and adamalysin n=1 Tax=Pseudobacteroides cellulosolvens ATCC 35603 = DSM 2933 TaxID=398512 RepID=A0A0L6JP73_9FIRM|nr:hypothetical protein [Pseudobacteroides cellulosolvens]KNY27579.1 peptidase M10A and M12B matrixin and adamalysin [Pseudobacteroides cellulosolvens ATCC 35603 = DSM 2933]